MNRRVLVPLVMFVPLMLGLVSARDIATLVEVR